MNWLIGYTTLYAIICILHANNTGVDMTHNIGASILKLGDIDTQLPDKYHHSTKLYRNVAVVLLQVRSTSNNAEGDKRVICFRYSLVLHVW